jgi:hypothetical protein
MARHFLISWMYYHLFNDFASWSLSKKILNWNHISGYWESILSVKNFLYLFGTYAVRSPTKARYLRLRPPFFPYTPDTSYCETETDKINSWNSCLFFLFSWPYQVLLWTHIWPLLFPLLSFASVFIESVSDYHFLVHLFFLDYGLLTLFLSAQIWRSIIVCIDKHASESNVHIVWGKRSVLRTVSFQKWQFVSFIHFSFRQNDELCSIR